MNTGSCIAVNSMKPCCRILINSRSSSIFGSSPSKSSYSVVDNLFKSRSSKLTRRRNRFHCHCICKSQAVGYKRAVDLNRKAFCVSYSNLGQSRVSRANFRVINRADGNSNRGLLVIPKVASDIRNHSTSVDPHVNEKSFEKIYIQGSLNVKELMLESIETGNGLTKKEDGRLEVNKPNVSVDVDNSKGLNETKVEREVSQIEKEAWQLLRSAVVSYCGNPVGTVAASDPADKQPLNYDQVFIRDFVPSALAFLLNGEGEIVKNFLLHTLQLQVFQLLNILL